MNSGAWPTGIDLVDFRELRMFMFRDDNLYTINVPPERRNFPILRHYEEVCQHGYPKTHLTLETAPYCEDSRYGFQMLMAHLHTYGIPVHLMDVGGFIGDFSLLLANFARSCNIRFHADVFDPSPAGTLIQPNIELNGLQDYVSFHPLAVSHVDGPLQFTHTIGHLDSASIQMGERKDMDYIVRSTRLSTFIHRNGVPEQGLLVKLDTEGMEPLIIRDLLDALLRPPIIVTEFTPSTFGTQIGPIACYLRELAKLYVLYDVSHLPYPSRVRIVPEDDLVGYVQMIGQRCSGYADLLLLPRELPGLDDLRAQFSQTEKGQSGLYNLVGTAKAGTD